MKINTKEIGAQRIALRQRKRICGTTERPRLRVFRSVSHIYAQVIDDMSGDDARRRRRAPSRRSRARSPKDVARRQRRRAPKALGKTIAERLIEKGIKRVVFDRSGFLYHGRIRAVADAARKAGLEF